MKKITGIVVIIALIVGGVLLLKKRMQGIEKTATPVLLTYPVKVVSPETAFLQQTSQFLARLTSVDSASMASKFSGQIKSVPVTENQKVKNGDLLVQIDDRETVSAIKSLEETLRAQEADLKYTEGLHQRNKALFKVGGLAMEKLEASEVACAGKQAAVEATREKIEALRIQLTYLNIRAPFDGTVGTIFLKEGALAVPGQPLVSIHSINRKLTFNYVPGQPGISEGQDVLSDERKIGKVLKRYMDAQNGLSVAEVVLGVPLEGPNDSYLPIQVVVFAGKGCTVPVNALLHQKEGVQVMVYEDSRFQPFPVTVLAQNKDRALIKPCPTAPVALGTEAKLSLLPTYGPVKISRGKERE